jgi:hypothetical protein
LVDIVLILSDADGLWIDLDEFGEGILQATRDRDRSTNG